MNQDQTFFAYACNKLKGNDEEILMISENKKEAEDFALKYWESLSEDEQAQYVVSVFTSRFYKENDGTIVMPKNKTIELFEVYYLKKE